MAGGNQAAEDRALGQVRQDELVELGKSLVLCSKVLALAALAILRQPAHPPAKSPAALARMSMALLGR